MTSRWGLVLGLVGPVVAAFGAAVHAPAFPVRFEANRGQWDSGTSFAARTAHGSVALTATGVRLLPNRGEAVAWQWLGARTGAVLAGSKQTQAQSSYFIGRRERWVTNAPQFLRVSEADLYPGVDLVYHGHESNVEYDLVVKPGGDPYQIALAASAGDCHVEADGSLVLGESRQGQPHAYQEIDGQRHPVPARYVRRGANLVGFELGEYDHTLPLTVDPTLFLSTYLGGSLADYGTAIALDQSGNLMVAGFTRSVDFPISSGALQQAPGGAIDSVLMKFDASGALVFSTYFGGSGNDEALGIGADAAGNVYAMGLTDSPDLPTVNAFQTALGGNAGNFDSFVCKLSPDGAKILYSTYLGGSGDDVFSGFAVDRDGNTYMGGSTTSPDFPLTSGAYQSSTKAILPAVVTKLNPTGNALVFSTALAGSYDNEITGLTIDTNRNVYVTGMTDSADFPITAGAVQSTFLGGSYLQSDAFVSKLDPTGGQLLVSTFYGGSDDEVAANIAVDSAGAMYISGITYSLDVPLTANGFDTKGEGANDCYVAKISPDGTRLVFGTFLGGNGANAELYQDYEESPTGLAVDRAGDVFVTGYTYSPDFPMVNAFEPVLNGACNAFAAELSPDGSRVVESSFLGGSLVDQATALALDPAGPFAYVLGIASSTDFPTTANAPYRSTPGGTTDIFLSILTFPASSGSTSQSSVAPRRRVLADGSMRTKINAVHPHGFQHLLKRWR